VGGTGVVVGCGSAVGDDATVLTTVGRTVGGTIVGDGTGVDTVWRAGGFSGAAQSVTVTLAHEINT